MKFVNLRNRHRQPVVLIVKHPYVQFRIDSMTCDLKKGTLKVDSNETDVVQHITLAFVTATLYLLVQPRPPVLPPNDGLGGKRGPKSVILRTYRAQCGNLRTFLLLIFCVKLILVDQINCKDSVPYLNFYSG